VRSGGVRGVVAREWGVVLVCSMCVADESTWRGQPGGSCYAGHFGGGTYVLLGLAGQLQFCELGGHSSPRVGAPSGASFACCQVRVECASACHRYCVIGQLGWCVVGCLARSLACLVPPFACPG
jgi:hypothetical protein